LKISGCLLSTVTHNPERKVRIVTNLTPVLHYFKVVPFWRPTMSHTITESCVACGACISECPTEAIKEGDPIYTIDADTCIDCGACADTCPNEAIVAG
jgi:ferredoxin